MRFGIALLIVVLAFFGVRWFFGTRLSHHPHPMEAIATLAVHEILPKSLEGFRRDIGRYPTTEEGLSALLRSPTKDERWMGPYYAGEIPLDPWGHPYGYRAPASKGSAAYDLWSLGSDGVQSADDIGNWTK